MSGNFYEQLQGFSHFTELTDASHYVDVPDDWYVVISDVKGSTQAIAQGRYKDVNMGGAAAIIAVLNAAGRVPLPYAFGGDGATMLVPPDLLDTARGTLSAVQTRVQQVFGLELRAGCIPLSALYAHGAWLKLAKFQLSKDMAQAAFQGTALALAETWLKKGGGPALHCQPADDSALDLEGLECRWQPVHNRHGTMLSLLVRVMPQHEARAWDIYSDILRLISVIYPESGSAHPAHGDNLKLAASPGILGKEAGIRNKGKPLAYAGYLLMMYFQYMVGALAFTLRRRIGTFDGPAYLAEMIAHTDARKFDEMLRMVLDSSMAQKDTLEELLRARQARGEIAYGLHLSPEALMTCLVFNLSGNHVHFIDGSDGGYAIAAQQMKAQLARMAMPSATHTPVSTAQGTS